MKILQLLAVSLLLVSTAYPQQNIGVNLSAGYFSPTEEGLKEVYGGGVVFGGEVVISASEQSDLCLGFNYFQKNGEGIQFSFSDGGFSGSGADAQIRIVPITVTGKYKFPLDKSKANKTMPYIGGGIGMYLLHENIDAQFGSVETDKSGFGFHFVAGVQSELGNNKNLFGEFKFSSASIKTEGPALSGSEADVGGISFFGGIKF